MCSYSNLKTVEQIISESFRLPDVLTSYQNYLAHTPNETLTEHTELTLVYLNIIVDANRLNPVIDKLIESIIRNREKLIHEWGKRLFVDSIAFHDFGKVNVNFQADKMKNVLFEVNDDAIGSRHSLLGAYIFIVYYLDLIFKENFNVEDKTLLSGLCLLFSYSIINHHNSELSIEFSKNKFEQYVDEFSKYLESYKFQIDSKFQKQFFVFFERNLKQSSSFITKQNENEFNLWCLLKLQFSLLTAADYYATNHYKSGLKKAYDKNDLGIIGSGLSKKIVDNFTTTKEYNRELYSDFKRYLKIPLSDLQIPSFDNLCLLRQKLGAEIIEGINENKEERVFYIEAPTGGGKTNLSMLAIVRLLDIYKDEITNIFYVFPFTTLVTQTHTAIKETFGLTDKDIIQLHSKAGFHTKKEENEDGVFGNDKQNYIDYMFVNYPFCLTTHIKFFDIQKSNNKETNYILHRLANSIVIIDELQSYSPSEWDKLKYFISNFAEAFNIRFIIMSATLPKIHSIAAGAEIQFNSLVKDVQSRYLQNPNFKDRVLFDFSLIDKYETISIDELTDELLSKSNEYYSQNGSVHTIIEFIHKKSTTEFYDSIIKNKDKFAFDSVLILSGTILEPRRQEIIDFLKDSKNRSKNVLLITTQVVEAGVDIDMDLGFKNISLLDSDEQLAGRINRNAKKDKCKLFLFKKDEPFRVYNNDFRYRFSKSLYNDKIKRSQILEKKDFKLLYELVMQKINEKNRYEFTKNLQDYIGYIKNLHFTKVNEDFKLIDNDSISFFVPLDIVIELNDQNKSLHFSEVEYEFLNDHNCIKADFVIGERVWGVYCSTIINNQSDFVMKAIELKILGGIISKFTFSMFNSDKLLNDMKPFLKYDEEKGSYKMFGYYCLNSDYQEIYGYKKGLDERRLSDGVNIF